MCGFFLDKSHYISKFKLCVSIDVHSIFVPVKCQKPAKTLSDIYTASKVGGNL